jgi:hypothetical protein
LFGNRWLLQMAYEHFADAQATLVVQKMIATCDLFAGCTIEGPQSACKKRPRRSAGANNHEIEGCHRGVRRIGWRRRQKTGAA